MNVNEIQGFSSIKNATKLYQIGEKELNAIQEYRGEAAKHMDEFIADFYEWLPTLPEYHDFFSRPGLIQSVKEKQIIYWTQLFNCDLNEEYLNSRFKVGNVHARINLPVNSYIAAMNFSFSWWVEKASSSKLKGDKLSLFISSLNKIFALDTAIVSASYTQSSNEIIEEQSRALVELSTPTIQLWEGILVLPILGVLDSKRAQDMTDVMLNKIQSTNAHSIIIDITGVPTVDSSVANHLIKITKATRLMGCNCILSGIGPEIAQTLVHLGINLESVETAANLMTALRLTLTRSGHQIIIQEDSKD